MRLNPRVDFAFKKLFGSEGNKDLLIAFINAVLPEEDQVASLTLKNPYSLKDFASEKTTILDILALDTHGRHLTIEMQITDQLHYEKRALYYWSGIYCRQLGEGNQYDELKKTIAIHILNFNLMDETHYHNVYRIRNDASHKIAFEDFQLHTIELKKFTADLQHLKSALDRWVTFLTKAHEYSKNKIPIELKEDPAIEKAIEVLDTLYLEEDERAYYESRLKWLRDEEAAISKAEYRGRIKGKSEGKAEGKAEERLTIAKKLLASGMTLDQVMGLTGLTKAEI